MKFLSFRVWILVIALFFALLAIHPRPWADGLEVKSVQSGSQLALAGLSSGEKVLSINGQSVDSAQMFATELARVTPKSVNITLTTTTDTVTYVTAGSLGFIHQNLTILSVGNALSSHTTLRGSRVVSLNEQMISSVQDLNQFVQETFPSSSLTLVTDEQTYALSLTEVPSLTVVPAPTTNIQKGLDLAGGTRVLLRPVSEIPVTDQQVTDLIAVLNNRLNVYGLADLKIRSANDLVGDKFVLIEIAGVTREEIRDLLAQQGKFEAKIGDDLVFEGGKGDIPLVCRNDGTCAGIVPPCTQLAQDQWTCTFQFAITLSEEAANRHALSTDTLDVNSSSTGNYLSKTIDFYLDGTPVDSLRIGADLKGQKTTRISITGPGSGMTEQAAYDDALKQMDKLQTILITGSLPFGLEIVKLDTISPAVGEAFVNNSILLIVFSLISVSLIIYLRYRRIKIVLPMIFILLSELILTLGVAALISWNIDLASIAGIIAAIGTGINDQLILVDEVVRSQQRIENWKEKIKRAFAIIFASFATIAASMLPLWSAGAGLVRGFAVTTLIGITIGVFITRPAFASIMETFLRSENVK